MKDCPLFLRNHSAERLLFTRRSCIAFIGAASSMLLLLGNLFYLQIYQHQSYHTRSNENCIKLLPIPPTRGLIYDRNGILLASNPIRYQLTIVPGQVGHLAQTLQELTEVVGLTEQEHRQFEKKCQQNHPLTPILLKTALTEKQRARFAVEQHRFTGVEMQGHPRRYYPYGRTLTHVIGYLAKINEKERQWLQQSHQKGNYIATQEIGKLGVERYYEQILHGQTGYEKVEINRQGHVIRRIEYHPPQAGKNITLTLDIHLQRYIEQLMEDCCGAAVVMDPRNGDILALVSSPSYDPNRFIEGMTYDDYQMLHNDPQCPFINRVTQGLYPPASTIKPFISVAALEEHVITHHSLHFDPGWWQLPGTQKRYRDWKRWGHGQINLTRAIEQSVDTFFYQIAYDLGIDRLSHWMHRFGYGEYSGIDLAEEQAGLMPSREWKMQRHQKPWYHGDTIPIGIGQGYWTATPIQMVKALSILINEGTVETPHLLDPEASGLSITRRGSPSITLRNPTFWKLAKDGMYGVANRPNGTAWRAFARTPYKAAVKSGTGQVFNLKDGISYQPKKLTKQLHDHAWLIAFAPYEKPQIALAIIMEHAGSGAKNAGPLARKILDYLLLSPPPTASSTG